jgi:hypothetical protein
MIKDITFEEVPAFAVVEKRIQTIIPNAEIVETQLDEAPFHFLFHIQFTKRTTLRLSKELMDDLPGSFSVRFVLCMGIEFPHLTTLGTLGNLGTLGTDETFPATASA